MAKIIPKEMGVKEFRKNRGDWLSTGEICARYGLSSDTLLYRLRNFRGRIEMLRVKGGIGHRFRSHFYNRKQVYRMLYSYDRRRNRGVSAGAKLISAEEAAHLLGFANAISFRCWTYRSEQKPRRVAFRKKCKNGAFRISYLYELESVYECRNWFLQRKRSVDRRPVSAIREVGGQMLGGLGLKHGSTLAIVGMNISALGINK